MDFLEEFKQSEGFTGVAYTSAKTSLNVEAAMLVLIGEVVKRGVCPVSPRIGEAKDSLVVRKSQISASQESSKHGGGGGGGGCCK